MNLVINMYNVYILILLFYTYSFIGWLIEVIVSIIQRHKLINRGFLIGPICPIYGFGGVLILILLNRYADDPLILFIMSVVVCSILEYFTSYLMEKIFKNRWWDYSDKKFNINGRICLECAIPFGIAAVIMFYGLNPVLISAYTKLSFELLRIIALSLLAITIVDVAVSYSIILTLKNISNSLRCDSTELITKKVREILAGKNYLHRRLVESFPKMHIYNKLASLKEKILKNKKALKLEKKKSRENKKIQIKKISK